MCTTAPMQRKSVCVIGAGPSGLVTLKELLAEGHNVVCFEASKSIGGDFAWRNYKNLLLTISNYYMAFSDFPPPPGDGYRYWTGQEYFAYLNSYADHFGLRECIRLNTRVSQVTRAGPNKWLVKFGTDESQCFDGVAVCCGLTPNLESRFPTLKKFKGGVLHSSNYTTADRYAGKNVLVVGLGESGADIVRDISEISQSCTLLLKSYPFLIRRINKNGVPADCHTTRMFSPAKDEDSIPIWLVTLVYVMCWIPFYYTGLLNWWNTYPDGVPDIDVKTPDGKPVDSMYQSPRGQFCDYQTERGMPGLSGLIAKWHTDSNSSHLRKFATKNVSFIPNILKGKIEAKLDSITDFDDQGVIFKSSGYSKFDEIVICTGYTLNFSFLDPLFQPKDNNMRNFLKHAFNPVAGHSLCFVGFARPTTGGVPTSAELVARYFSLLMSGKKTLPPTPQLVKIIEEDKTWETNLFSKSPEITNLISASMFNDSLAMLIGCYTHPLSLITEPRFFLHWQTCIDLACRYRLSGPHAKPQLARAWMNRALTSEEPLLTCFFIVKKLLYLMNIGTYDTIVDMRRLGVELTSREKREKSPTASILMDPKFLGFCYFVVVASLFLLIKRLLF